MRGRRIHIAHNLKAYSGRSRGPRMTRRRALPAHFLAPSDDAGDTPGPSSPYRPGVDEYEDYDEDLPEIAYLWD
jgi:hypothetical protein